MKQIAKSILLLTVVVIVLAMAGCSVSPGSKSSYGGAVGSVAERPEDGAM
jgi:hypothetical protein